MPSDARSEAFAALARFLVTEISVGDTLRRLAGITVDAVPSAEFAGITMLQEDGKPTTGVFTDEESPEIDAAQYQSGHGPCLDAWRTGRVVTISDMAAAKGEYPEFSAAATDHGVLSTMSLPLVTREMGIGALNLYARHEFAFTADDESLGLDLAAAASTVLANVSAYWTASELNDNLNEAMRSRGIIEQAKGMLMAQSPHMTADEAFTVLRKASQRENLKLRDIASRIVARQPLHPSGD